MQRVGREEDARGVGAAFLGPHRVDLLARSATSSRPRWRIPNTSTLPVWTCCARAFAPVARMELDSFRCLKARSQEGLLPSQRRSSPLPNSYWVVPGQLLAGEYPGGASREETKERLQKLDRRRRSLLHRPHAPGRAGTLRSPCCPPNGRLHAQAGASDHSTPRASRAHGRYPDCASTRRLRIGPARPTCTVAPASAAPG